VFEYQPEGRQALEPSVAYATTSVLRGVITGGTARSAAIGRPAAGKTGTSQNYRDAWFAGYTPQLSQLVWVGYYQQELPMRNVHGRRGFGGTLAAPIWAGLHASGA
jgi:penicillin-binding protein 1A